MTTVRPSTSKSRCVAWTTGEPPRVRDVVAVEGDVEVAERDVDVEQLGEQLAAGGAASTAPRRWMPTSASCSGVAAVLDDLVGDARERRAHVVAVEDDLRVWHVRPSWPHGTGLKELLRCGRA